jgi:multiple sugar transport system substrate-binding protein
LTRLRGLGWDHPRCLDPLRAMGAAWEERHGVEIEWSARSLTSFGDQPLEEVVGGFDLVMIDYPFAGTGATKGLLLPLDELVEPETLAALAADSVGPSHDSYRYDGHQWGFATDAACHVQAVQGVEPPESWDEALALARTSRAALPLSPAHSLSSFMTLCRGRFEDRSAAAQAFEMLTELHALGPQEAVDWEPPETLALLEAGALDYVPLTYGYKLYRCRFADVPGVTGAILGGAGLAVIAGTSHPEEAAAFAAWASGAEAQTAYVAQNGGQPGSRTAWLAAADPFFADTLATIEQAWPRPNDPWWPPFQVRGGELLTEALRARRPADETLDALAEIHRDCVATFG